MTSRFASANLGGHMRAPSGLSTLYLGVSLVCEFAQERGVINADRTAAILQAASDALLRIGKRQAEIGRGQSPALRFVETLAAMLAQGRVWLRGNEAMRAERHGPSTTFVGWRDRDVVHLLFDPAHKAVSIYLREQGETLGGSPARTREALVKEGIALRRANASERTPPFGGGGGTSRALSIPAALLLGDPRVASAEAAPRALTAVGSPELGALRRGSDDVLG
jgi:hypothetical protein